MTSPERHVVLVHPEIHWNTGNAGRTCLGTGAKLHLIHPLGFSLEDKHVKRAGLDYWEHVDIAEWNSFEAFQEALKPQDDEIALITKYGKQLLWELPKRNRLFLLFGSETKGLPASIHKRYGEQSYRIPQTNDIRSLNLSTTVGIALFENLRPTPQQS